MNCVTSVHFQKHGLFVCLYPPSERPCPYKGRLIKILEKTSRETFQIQVLVLQFLTRREVGKLTSKLPSGWGSYEINCLLEKACLPVTDFPFKIIDDKVWRKCFGEAALMAQGLSFKEAPSLQSLNGLRFLNQLSCVPVEYNAGFTLLTLPKGLTLNKLIKLAAKPQSGHQPAVIAYIHPSILALEGDKPIQEGVVAISNGLLVDSKNKSVEEQSSLVARYGCQMPRIVEAVTLCFLNCIHSSTTEISPVRLLNDAPWSYTRCIEQVAVQNTLHHSVVGGFALSGLHVRHDFDAPDRYGVCASRRLRLDLFRN